MRSTPLLLVAVLVATPLAAQFHVPRPKVPNPVDRVTQRATQAVTPARQPTFDDRVLEMTDARLTALIRGLRAEQQQRPALEAGYKRNADARAAYVTANRAQGERANAAATCLTDSPEYRAIYGDTASQRKAAERLRKARDRGDDRLVQKIEDSTANAMMAMDPRVAMGMVTAQQRCNSAHPVTGAPTATQPPPDAPSTRLVDSLRIIGTGASGLTDDQFSVMGERVLAFLNTDEAELRNSLWAYSNTEMTALRARRAELQRYQTLLTDG